MSEHCSLFSISLLFRCQLLDDTYHGSQITDLKNSKQNHLRGNGRLGSAGLMAGLDGLEGLFQPNMIIKALIILSPV